MRTIGTLIAIAALAAACTSSGGAGASTASTHAPRRQQCGARAIRERRRWQVRQLRRRRVRVRVRPGCWIGQAGRIRAAVGGALVIAQADGAPGAFLTGKDGLTLYIFKKDTPNASACEDDCAANWPPLTVAADGDATAAAGLTGALTTFARPDGSLQVAYDGAPLYYFAADKAAGDTKGQGVGDVWFVAAP